MEKPDFIIGPKPGDPHLTRAVAGVDHDGRAQTLRVVEERPLTIFLNSQEIVTAMRLIWERMKIIVEPSCAVPLAALLKEQVTFRGQRVGIILTGGNVDLGKLPF